MNQLTVQRFGMIPPQIQDCFLFTWMPIGLQPFETAPQPLCWPPSTENHDYFPNYGYLPLAEPLPSPQNESQEPEQVRGTPSLTELTLLNSSKTRVFWNQTEDLQLISLYTRHEGDWAKIASEFPNRSISMCYSRYRRLQTGKKRHWKKNEDQLIIQLVGKYGYQWKYISNHLQTRSPKQVREHYLNFLQPGINKSAWTPEEDKKICELVTQFGRRWKSFEDYLPGRYENLIKARYYGHLRGILDRK